jgi:hypothetical protein
LLSNFGLLPKEISSGPHSRDKGSSRPEFKSSVRFISLIGLQFILHGVHRFLSLFAATPLEPAGQQQEDNETQHLADVVLDFKLMLTRERLPSSRQV